jgi:excisionase family DNA binding protein
VSLVPRLYLAAARRRCRRVGWAAGPTGSPEVQGVGEPLAVLGSRVPAAVEAFGDPNLVPHGLETRVASLDVAANEVDVEGAARPEESRRANRWAMHLSRPSITIEQLIEDRVASGVGKALAADLHGHVPGSTTGRVQPSPLEPLAYSVMDAAAVLGVSRAMLYELIASGELPSTKLGSRRLIRREALVCLLEKNEVEAPWH